jgi:outer membrane protein insertion porin family
MSRSVSSPNRSIRFLLSLSVLVVACASVIAQETNVEKRPALDLTGNKVFSKPELLGIVNSQLDEWAASKYEPAMLDYSLHKMEVFMKSRGYLQSRVTKGDIEQSEAGPRVLLAVIEGPLYRVGKMTVDGTRLLTPEQVLEAIGLKTGEIANGKKVSEGMFEHLKNRYGKFGYIQYTAEIVPTFHAEIGDAEGVVDLKLTIDEGEQFTVRSVKIDSADKALTEVLTRELMLRAGDIYDNELLRESVTRMNRTGLVAKIDGERDVEFTENKRKTGEQALLDLVIHVKKAGALAAR